ncbi:MAG: oligosaccharide flippase family protein [Acidobacteriia bacterium]|nr:oligosaccharide flippase family protein [Terriglobia bacterium]
MKPFDTSGVFLPNVDGDQVRRLAARGAGATLASSALGLAIQIISTMILARLLTPKDFGLMTMVTTVSLLLMNFGLNGFTEAILQADDVDHYLVSNLFWINLGVGVLLTIGFAAAGSLLARFYGDPLVARVAVGISPTILITSISVQHLALLKRAMRFSAVSANDVLARVVGVVVSIVLGWAGWGYWALVAGAVALSLSTSLGAFYLCRWVPGLPQRRRGTRSMFQFAMNAYGRFSVNYCTRNLDNVLVGWRFGPISLGFYKKAYDLFALSVSQSTAPLTNVAVAALSRFRGNPAKYRQHLLSAITVTAFVGMGLAAALTIVGKDLIRLLLGPGWEPAGRIFTFFGPGIGVMLIYYMHGWIHLSIGRADRWFRWGVIEVVVTGLLFLLALPWGAVGIALAWTTSFWILTIPAFQYAGKPIGLGVTPVLAAVWKYVLAALLAGFLCAGIISKIPLLIVASGTAGEVIHIVAISALVGCLYVAAVILMHWGYAPFREIARVLEAAAFLRKISDPSAAAIMDAAKPAYFVPQSSSGKALVSILIPAFNSQEWIADTLRSAIAQTYEPKEIIVVDDGSTDQTLTIARRFESESVRVVTQKNQGAAAARNKALSLSRGDYIQWLDADDLLAPDKVAKQMAVLDQGLGKRTVLSGPFGRFRYRYYRAEFAPTGLWRDLCPTEWLLCKMGQNAYMQTATWLVSRELTEAAGPWDTRLLGDDDGEYFCRVLLASDGTRFVPEAKVYYRAPWANTLSYIGDSARKLEAHWLSMRLHIQYLRSLEDSERARNACLRYLQTCLIYFYPEKVHIVKDAEQIASELGGRLEPPHLPWKYSWLRIGFGWGLAKRLQILLPRIRWSVEKSWDKALFWTETNFGTLSVEADAWRKATPHIEIAETHTSSGS